MGLKNYIRDELLLEGGKALKTTNGIKQKHVKPLLAELLPKIAKELRLSPNLVMPIGSAGRKPNPDDLSGDIDIAVQTVDIDRVRAAIERLCVNGEFRSMPAINVYSFSAAHPEGTVQVDLMPVPDLKLAAWAFYSADSDLQQGLKGSHRNEVLFALAKHCGTLHHPKGDCNDAERTRYLLDLNTGLHQLHQTRIGKKGKPVKGYTTLSKKLITADPDEICKILFGYQVPASAVLSLDDAMRALNDERFGHKHKWADVIATTAEGMKRKELSLPSAINRYLAA